MASYIIQLSSDGKQVTFGIVVLLYVCLCVCVSFKVLHSFSNFYKTWLERHVIGCHSNDIPLCVSTWQRQQISS
jgi:hypothetical protein